MADIVLKGDGVNGTAWFANGSPSHESEDGQTSHVEQRMSPGVVSYSLITGIVAAGVGGVVGLTVAGTTRIAVWCTVAGATSIVSGLAHDSAAIGACWSGLRRLIRGSSGSSA